MTENNKFNGCRHKKNDLERIGWNLIVRQQGTSSTEYRVASMCTGCNRYLSDSKDEVPTSDKKLAARRALVQHEGVDYWKGVTITNFSLISPEQAATLYEQSRMTNRMV